MPSRRLRPVERRLALAAIEAGEVTAAQCDPGDAVAVDVHAADAVAALLGRHLEPLRERGLVRVRARREADDRAGNGVDRSPDRSIGGRVDAVELVVNQLVLGRIDRILRADVRIALAVAVGVEDEARPPLRLLRVVRLVPHLRVQPAEDRVAHAEVVEPERVVRVLGEIEVMRVETEVDVGELLRLRVVHRRLPHGLVHREALRGGMARSGAAPRGRGRRTDARGHPEAALAVEHRVVHVAAARPDVFIVPVRRRLQIWP